MQWLAQQKGYIGQSSKAPLSVRISCCSFAFWFRSTSGADQGSFLEALATRRSWWAASQDGYHVQRSAIQRALSSSSISRSRVAHSSPWRFSDRGSHCSVSPLAVLSERSDDREFDRVESQGLGHSEEDHLQSSRCSGVGESDQDLGSHYWRCLWRFLSVSVRDRTRGHQISWSRWLDSDPEVRSGAEEQSSWMR